MTSSWGWSAAVAIASTQRSRASGRFAVTMTTDTLTSGAPARFSIDVQQLERVKSHRLRLRRGWYPDQTLRANLGSDHVPSTSTRRRS